MHEDQPTSPLGGGKASGFRSLLGYRVTRWETGLAEIELALGAEHLNGMGIVHGGLYATLLDAACGHAATWCSVPGNTRACVTVSLTTHFLASVASGHIRAVGRLETVAGRTAICRAEITDAAGMLLAIAQGTFLYARGSERVEGVVRRS